VHGAWQGLHRLAGGYTNAGKSTLFNTLTHAGAIAEDRLFATLDTTTRRLYLPEAGNVAISDTVGLSAIFRTPWSRPSGRPSTSDTRGPPGARGRCGERCREAQIVEVDKVLAEIGASAVPGCWC